MSERSQESDWRKRRRDHAAARLTRESNKRRKEAERQHRAEEEHRRELRVQRLVEEAVVKTENADHRTQKLDFLLMAAAAHLPGPLDFSKLKEDVPELDLGEDAEPHLAPRWETYAPKSASLSDRLFHRGARHRRATEEAERAYNKALERYRLEEAARKQRIERLRKEHEESISLSHRRILEHNEEIDEFESRVYAGDRIAVSDYYERVFEQVKDKPPFPDGRSFAYVPESRLLLIEWAIPSIDIVPREKEFRYNKSTDQVEVYKYKPVGEIRETYQNLLAQLGIRAAKTAFLADPNWLVETVVFNGMLTAGEYDEDEENDQIIEVEETVCLLSMRATRHHFARLDLKDLEPLEVARRRLSAEISLYPDELVGVTPLLPYELADPHLVIEPEGVNVYDAGRDELYEVVLDLLDRMGFETELLRASDTELDFLASRQTSSRQELHVVHVRQVEQIANPADVRELHHAVRREKADAGTLLITGGFDPRSFEYANGKPLHLLDGYGLVALCAKYGIPAYIDRTSAESIDDGANGVASAGGRASLPQQRIQSLPSPLRMLR